MEKTRNNGNANPRYNHSNGTLNIPLEYKHGKRHNSVPNGQLNYGNGNAAYDRMCSVASTNMDKNSALTLVVQTKDESNVAKKGKCNKCVFRMLFILMFCCVITMTTLYIVELKNTSDLRKLISQEGPATTSELCYERATPIKIKNIANEKEIKTAMLHSMSQMHQLIAEEYFAASVTVYYMGELIWSYNIGHIDYHNKRSSPPTIDTPYPIASVSKVFTVMMLYKLVHDGVIKSLDDDVQAYEPRFSVHNSFNNENITFRQLSSMMSGLPREGPCYPFQSKPHLNICPYSTSEMLVRIKNLSLLLPPGSQPTYSNVGIALLGRILEKIVNQTFETWVKKNILEPFNMKNTGYDITARENDFPKSKDKKDNVKETVHIVDWGWLNPSGGMYSSASDLGKLGSLFLHNIKSQVFPREMLNQMLSAAYMWSAQLGRGYPFEILPVSLTPKKANYMTYGKDGLIFGYGAFFSVVPELNLNVNAVVAHKSEGAGTLASKIQQLFIIGLDSFLQKKSLKYILPSSPDQYVGSYKIDTFWPLVIRTVNLTLENGILYSKIEYLKTPLSQIDNHVLQNGAFDKSKKYNCWLLGSGLLKEKYYFTPPPEGESKCPSFHINGVSAFGYVRFVRVNSR